VDTVARVDGRGAIHAELLRQAFFIVNVRINISSNEKIGVRVSVAA